MIDIRIGELVRAVEGDLIIGDPNAAVGRIVTDSRTLKKGDFFIALKGKKYDAHDFIGHVLEKGASGIMLDKLVLGVEKNPWNIGLLPHIIKVGDTFKSLHKLAYYNRSRFNVHVIGITGTNGKTTTKEMLASIIAEETSVLCTKGNLNNHIGLPMMLFELEPDHEYAVLEMGASALGEIAELSKLCNPVMGIITNISPAHIEGFGSMENILKAKWELIDALPRNGDCIMNADDNFLMRNFYKSRANITTFGASANADVIAEDVSLWPTTQFTLKIEGRTYRLQIPVMGMFNVYNAVAAAAAAWRLGIRVEKIIKGLEEFSVPAMRMQVVRLSNTNILVNDAYNANPKSMMESIKAFNAMYAMKRKILVLGTMNELGEISADEHYNLGKFIALQAVDKVYWCGRYGDEVANGLMDQFDSDKKMRIFDSHAELIPALIKELENPCAILFKASRANQFENIVESVKENYKPG